jgi:hypothetical protein
LAIADEEHVMFTKDMIVAAQARVKSGADYPRLVQELKEMGVQSYDHVVADINRARRTTQRSADKRVRRGLASGRVTSGP